MTASIEKRQTRGKILFACVPAEGHFNPLTGLAIHLQQAGYDVRWYAASAYGERLRKLGIPHYPFEKAMDITADELETEFPERASIKSVVKKLNFDMEHFFIRRAPEYYADISRIRKEFPFSLLIADVAFTGSVFVKELMQVPVIGIGVFPLVESSRDLAPNGLGLTPAKTFFGKVKHAGLRFLVKKVLFRKSDKLLQRILDEYCIVHNNVFIFDLLGQKADYILQSGTPGFEYKRSDLSHKVRFVGSLLPYNANTSRVQWYDKRLDQYQRVILVTQGTVEKNGSKLLVPVLEAYKGTDTLVVCTTGGAGTRELQEAYPFDNIIIADFIPFSDVMPYSDVYITNGGYGGVMLSIQNKVPMVAAGVHEGKNEICARVGYFKCGINLKTETPTPAQLKKATEEIFANPEYRESIAKLANEFNQYHPGSLCEKYADELIRIYNAARPKETLATSYPG